ncbi:MAG: 30S ribosomal protein S9 [Longimicrobiales bacterium]|nr:30S ribosomal protein S9 [Longimicrobiales bacterium]
MSQDQIQTVGRRKSASARVILRPGRGEWTINDRPLEDYFPRATLQARVAEPLTVTDLDGQYDVFVRVRGGGLTGQADSVRLGLARALVEVDEDHRPVLRAGGMLTRDSRSVERKKPGQPKARKKFQFSKR